MTRSIWRLSHLSLALVASLFLILASISGIFLAYEPIQKQSKANFKSEWNNVELSKVIDSLQTKYLEVTSIEKDQNGFFIASVLTEEGEFETFQINPITGEKSGDIIKQSKFYEWMTTFHRSLFLDTLGRFFVGVTAVILLLISISGIILIIQRTKSIKSLFDKVEKTLGVRFYHIVFGRLAFIPLLLISITGGYLFLQRFDIIKKEETPTLIVDVEKKISNAEKIDFNKLKIGDLKKIEFPFSPDEEDYFIFQTSESEIAVHQYDQTILAKVDYPKTTIFTELSLNLHTGRTNSVWAFILGLSSISILYFIYSGIKMFILSLKGRIKNKFKAEESEILILTGSETGNTLVYSKLVYKQLIDKGYKVFITELNQYKPSDSYKQVIIFTSTYGNGDAPNNGNKFLQKWKNQPLKQDFNYSIVGFGSLAYKEFCQFANEINDAIKVHPNAREITPLVKIHNQSYHSLKTWAQNWNSKSGYHLELPVSFESKKLPLKDFIVHDKTTVKENDNETFTLKLTLNNKTSYQSGDLIVFYPPSDPYERMYSIGKLNNEELIISVKKHELGICSNYLDSLQKNQTVQAAIKRNSDFQYNNSKPAIFIGNGTGMGPFLGMITENKHKKHINLYWGGRTKVAYSLYENHLNKSLENKSLTSINIALSRESTRKEYVGDLIQRDGKEIINQLKQGAIIYICGSLAMQQDILKELDTACNQFSKKSLNYFQKKKQIKMDCY